MRHISKIVLLLLIYSTGYAQDREVRWQVKDTLGNPVSNADVIVRNTKSKVLDFDNTDSTGTVRFHSRTWPDSIRVEIRKSGFAPLIILISKRALNRIFVLRKKVENLDEVVLYYNPVKKKGDTLVFKAKSFRSLTDRNAEDLLKKLPGITIDSDGKIYYMGKAVSHLYVEGLDLTGGRYTGITRNVRAGDIEQIEIYQRHQPVRILQKTVPTEQVALNLKLKNRYTRLAVLQGGYIPFTSYYDAGFKPMMLSVQRQYLIRLRRSNRGIFKKGRMLTVNVQDLKYGFKDYFSRKDLIRPGFMDEYGIYGNLFNFKIDRSSETGGDFSYLVVDSHDENKQWRINALYNVQTSFFRDEMQIHTAGGSMNFTKHSLRKKTYRDAFFQLKRLINNDRFYLQSDLEMKIPSFSNRSFIRYNNFDVSQDLDLPYGVIGNKTHIITPFLSGLFESKTHVVYNYSRQSLLIPSVSFSSPYFSAGDTIKQQAFYAIRSFQQAFGLLKKGLFKTGIQYPVIVYRLTDVFLTTETYKGDKRLSENFQNKISVRQHSFGLISGWRKTYNKWLVSMHIPFTYRFWERKNLLNQEKIRLNRPEISIIAACSRTGIYSLTTLNYSKDADYRDLPEHLPGYSFADFNRVEKGDLIFFKTDRQSLYASYDYNWALRALSFRAQIGSVWGTNNYKAATSIDTTGFYQVTYKPGRYFFRYFNGFLQLGKYFLPSQITIDIRLETSQQKTQIWLNDELSGMQIHSIKALLSWRGYLYEWNYMLKTSYSENKRILNHKNDEIYTLLRLEAGLSRLIGKHLILRGEMYYLGLRNKQTFHNNLFTFRMRTEYKWNKNGIFYLQAENLNDVKKISEITYAPYQTVTKKMYLRPMEILLGLQFTF